MKKLSYNRKNVNYTPIKYWELSDGNIVAIYQGNRGENPELDYVVKYLGPGKRLRAPSHTHWIVDLLVKASYNKQYVKGFINEWIGYYDIIEPFKSVEDRNNYSLTYVKHFKDGVYNVLSNNGEYSIEFLSIMIELFIKCEKQSTGAYMFKSMLILVKEFCENKKDFYQVISHSKRV